MKTKSNKSLFPIGIGTWQIAGSFEPNPDAKYGGAEPVYGNEGSEIEALRYSIEKGQNYIDCAEVYGGFYTDEVVGRAIIGLKREDLYISDKLWKTSVGEGQVRPTVERMLEKLGTDYLDMLYIHSAWPNVSWQTAIPQIDELIDEGIVRHFGVSNFTAMNMIGAQTIAKHKITANQVNYSVLNKSAVNALFRSYCQDNDIQIIAYEPLKHREVLTNETVQSIAEEHGISPAQIALAWLVAKGAIPIPKATKKVHIDDNIAAASLILTDTELAQLDRIKST